MPINKLSKIGSLVIMAVLLMGLWIWIDVGLQYANIPKTKQVDEAPYVILLLDYWILTKMVF